jgi:aryl-alcohol dehydrogenase-like predicted oxidoreductase
MPLGRTDISIPPMGLGAWAWGDRTFWGYVRSIQPLIDLLRQIGEAHVGKTPAQVALNWTICKGAVPIPGAKNALQAEQNACALGWRLTPDEVAALDAERS